MKRLFTVFLIVLLYSCASSEVGTLLRDVESYIMEHPDSALTVLESVDSSFLRTQKMRANHALLYAMALDKNYINVTDDSIAQVAVDYYSRKGISKNKARAYYYLGIAYYYQKDYDKAILEFTKAEKVAELCDSLYWAMTKSIQAKVYSSTYNDIETLSCLKSALNIYLSISDYKKAQSVRLRIANQYLNQLDYQKADSLLTYILNSENVDNNIKSQAH